MTVQHSKVTRVKTERMDIPFALRKQIMRIQVEEGKEQQEACQRAAEILESNHDEFEKEVQKKVRDAINSQLLARVNKMRKSISEIAYQKGADFVRNTESRFQVPCRTCGELMYFSKDKENWPEVQRLLGRAFSNWTHVSCEKE